MSEAPPHTSLDSLRWRQRLLLSLGSFLGKVLARFCSQGFRLATNLVDLAVLRRCFVCPDFTRFSKQPILGSLEVAIASAATARFRQSPA